MLGERGRATYVLANLADCAVRLGRRSRRLFGDLLYLVAALCDALNAGVHLVEGGRGRLDGLAQCQGARGDLLDGTSHLRERRRGFLIGARQVVDLRVDATNRVVGVVEERRGFLHRLFLCFCPFPYLVESALHVAGEPREFERAFLGDVCGTAQLGLDGSEGREQMAGARGHVDTSLSEGFECTG